MVGNKMLLVLLTPSKGCSLKARFSFIGKIGKEISLFFFIIGPKMAIKRYKRPFNTNITEEYKYIASIPMRTPFVCCGNFEPAFPLNMGSPPPKLEPKMPLST